MAKRSVLPVPLQSPYVVVHLLELGRHLASGRTPVHEGGGTEPDFSVKVSSSPDLKWWKWTCLLDEHTVAWVAVFLEASVSNPP